MNNQEGITLETDDLFQAGAVIWTYLEQLSGDERQEVRISVQRANRRAIKNWLTRYQPVDREDTFSRIRGFLEAFYHLCNVEAWENATELLFLRIHWVNEKLQGSLVDPLHLQLGRWGYYSTQIQVYH